MPPYDDDFGRKNYTRYYAEQGAGVDFMITPVARLAARRSVESLLDVGCGFGFVVDFAGRQLGADAIGVEPSPYGRAGARELGVRIEPCYLEDNDSLAGRRFSVVYSSEVIEHVPAPEDFIRNLAARLEPDGVLILTTPNANWLEPSRSPAEIMPALSPGFHLILFSRRSMEQLLQRCGLPHCRVEVQGERLVVYASRAPLPELPDAQDVREQYVEYLQALWHEANPGSSIRRGAGYRVFKERVNLGAYAGAARDLEQLVGDLQAGFDFDPMDLSHAVRLARGFADFDTYGEHVPYFLTGLYYHAGMLHLNHTGDHLQAARLFAAAFDVAFTIPLEIQFLVEPADLVWRAKYHQGLAYLLAGRQDEAGCEFSFILENRDSAPPQMHGTLPPTDIVAQAEYQSGIVDLQRGDYLAAARTFGNLASRGAAGQIRHKHDSARHLGIAFRHLMERHAAALTSDARARELFLAELRLPEDPVAFETPAFSSNSS